jgi:hypothetical protein
MIRNLLAVFVVVTACTATASAGVVGLTSTVLPPFTVDTELTGHTGYILSAATDDGSLIRAVDVSITGQLHQRWVIDPDTGDVTPTPDNASLTNGDSHLTPIAGAVVARAPVEDNNGLGSPLADTATRDYGYGSFLRGVWGIPGPQQTNIVALGYIVIPDGSLPNISITAQVATSNGAFSLSGSDFSVDIPPPPPPPPLPPLLSSSPLPGPGTELYLNVLGTPEPNPSPQLVSLWNSGGGTISITSIVLDGPDASKYNLVGTLPTSLAGGAQAGLVGIDWATPGQPAGMYAAQLLVNTSAGNLVFDISTLVNPDSPGDEIIPEPSTLLLAGLGIAGLALRLRP